MQRNQIYALAIVAALVPAVLGLGQRILLPGHPGAGPRPGEDDTADSCCSAP